MNKVTQAGWDILEAWLEQVAEGQRRKNDEPMVGHWIRIGRSLRADGADDITVCGGYGHDLVEDVDGLQVDDMAAVFEAVLGSSEDAATAIQLVHDCSYQPEEYQLERDVAAAEGASAGKAARKRVACERWLAHPDPRVHQVKIFDVTDNDATCESVSEAFSQSYRAWAIPLRDGLQALRVQGGPAF